MIDLLVGGGGPAGLATALYAARAGLDVTVWEPRGGVIDKACGEGLMPGAVTALNGLGVDPAGHPLDGIRYVAGSAVAEASFRGGPGRGVRRTNLHTAMRAAVLNAGVEIVQRPVTRIVQHDDAVEVDGTRARYLVAADGLHSPTRRLLCLEGPAPRVRRYGLRRHVHVPAWTTHVEVHWSRDSEAYVTPVADDLVGVAILSSRRMGHEDHLRRFPALWSRLGRDYVGDVRGAGPLRQQARCRVAGRVLLVGDAAGYVDALTGEGVALGVAQARAAVSAVREGEPTAYEAEWRRITRPYRLLTASLLAASRIPPLRRGLVPAAATLPPVFAGAVNVLARPA